jgi:uncharacterized protein (DUF2164 family)
MLPPPSPDDRTRLIASIRRFFDEELEQDIGELKAQLVLDFTWKEVAPAAYNRGVADAQAWVAERLADLEGTCHADDSGYWAERRP